MSFKINRNEKCPCGSGLKHKKCCINKNIIDGQFQNVLPPENREQAIVRNQMDNILQNKPEIHCRICGDTEEDGKIIKIPNQTNKLLYLCEFCYKVQNNYDNIF
jgi:hypothetical protein